MQLSSYSEVKMKNYGLDLINVKSFWNRGFKGKGVVTAVIDSGCEIDHPEIKDNIIGVRNFTQDDGGKEWNVKDYSGHGTHVSGVIAGLNKNAVVGVAPESKLLILKTISKNGIGSVENVVQAIDYALSWKGPNNEKVEIINLSLGTKNRSSELKFFIDKAYEKNVIVVAAAGNNGDGSGLSHEILYPGFYNEVIQVSAGDKELKPMYFSNSNVEVDYLAPGDEIYSTYLNNSFARLSGTSMAAPHVSGATALLVGYYKKIGIKPSIKEIRKEFDRNVMFHKEFSPYEQGKGHIRLSEL